MTNTIGRYQLLDRLGEGAMSIVYKAFDPKVNRVIALKVLRDERNQAQDYRARFLREAKAVGALSHPNIVTVFDVGEADGRPYIGMEIIEGIPLNVAIKEGPQFDIATVLKLGIQIAEALNYAHEKGIVHRDVKPSNILLLENREECKITDFGIAHIDAQDMTYQTQVGEMLGTPQYMSPEQILGKKIDGRSDLFSLGVILYQLLSGKKPFDAPSVANVLFKIATENPQPIGQVAPHLPHSVKNVVDRLLKKQPEKRFQSGSELAQTLRRVLANFERGPVNNSTRISATTSPLLAVFGIIVIATLSATSYFQSVETKQNLIDKFGKSMSQLITYQIAEPLLAKDWPNVELIAHDIAEKQSFGYLHVVDHVGIIRGSSDATMLGKTFKPGVDIAPQANEKSVEIEIRKYNSPISFGSTNIGEIYLGINSSELIESEKTISYPLVGGIFGFVFFTLIGLFSWLKAKTSRAVMSPNTENT